MFAKLLTKTLQTVTDKTLQTVAEPLDIVGKLGHELASTDPDIRNRMLTSPGWATQMGLEDMGSRTGMEKMLWGGSRRGEIGEIRTRVTTMLAEGASGADAMQWFNHAIDEMLAGMVREAELEAGTPPCRYAVVGLGSFGRGELCPYSDLDMGLVIERDDRKTRAWSRRFGDALNRRVLQLGESLTSGWGIRSCMVLSPSGLLGEEITGTPEGIVEASAKTLDKGWSRIILSALLDRRCVVGDAALVTDLGVYLREFYATEPGRKMWGGSSLEIAALNDDQETVNIKHDFLRSPVFGLQRLAARYGLDSASSTGRLEEAVAAGVLDRNLAQATQAAMDFAMGLRFSNHLAASQSDDDVHLTDTQRADFCKHARVLARFTAEVERLCPSDG